MQRIKRIVFFADGVLLPTITEAALAASSRHMPKEPRLQLALYELERSLTRGLVSLETYCMQFVQLTEATISASDLIENVPAWTTLSSHMQELLLELSDHVELRLVAGYPASWLDPILQRGELPARLFGETVFFLHDLWEGPDYRAFFKRLEAQEILLRGRSMWVDWHSLRCMAAIRQDADAGIFVDAARFRRDLALWGLVSSKN